MSLETAVIGGAFGAICGFGEVSVLSFVANGGLIEYDDKDATNSNGSTDGNPIHRPMSNSEWVGTIELFDTIAAMIAFGYALNSHQDATSAFMGTYLLSKTIVWIRSIIQSNKQEI
jgi:hypothetical protein